MIDRDLSGKLKSVGKNEVKESWNGVAKIHRIDFEYNSADGQIEGSTYRLIAAPTLKDAENYFANAVSSQYPELKIFITSTQGDFCKIDLWEPAYKKTFYELLKNEFESKKDNLMEL
jgi:hypothetical protein